MATGLHEIVSDVEVVTGLLPLVGTGDIRVYFEATRDIGGLGIWETIMVIFLKGKMHLETFQLHLTLSAREDDAQTSDEEYHEIRVDARRRSTRFRTELDGEVSLGN
ncbi:unnamed protein product, partial [Linum tenue]